MVSKKLKIFLYFSLIEASVSRTTIISDKIINKLISLFKELFELHQKSDF